MLVTQKLNGCTFTTAVRVVCEGAEYVINNKREVKCVLPASEKVNFKVYITTALSTCGEDTETMATAQLAAAVKTGDSVYENHLNWWKEYWNRSFISIEDDVVENVYYMNRYQFGSSGYGDFPPSVFGSLWTAFGDTRNWGHYYHMNDQQQFWPCDTWNHGELLKPYFDYRRRMLPNAIADCKEQHGIDGAWYCDIASADGYQAIEPDTRRNMSCGAMMSLQMYRHYKHYLNRDFLINTAYPVMKACGDMYLNLLVKEEDGKYHIHDVTAMEGYLYLNDPINDWAMSRALFRALLDVADEAGASEELKDAWKDKLENMYELSTFEKDGRTVFAYGRFADGSPCTKAKYPESGHATGDLGVMLNIFPASIYGLYTTDEPYYDIIRNTMESVRGKSSGIGWDMINQSFARFGYTDELKRSLKDAVQKYMIFPNGLTHFSPEFGSGDLKARVIPEGADHTDWGDMHEKDKGERVVYSGERFVHFYSEPEGNICTAVNDSLLQSWEGIIRVFPASDDAVFRLHAEGDFMVSSQKTDGRVRFVAIESKQGGKVVLASPFAENECVRLDMADHKYTLELRNGQRLISFDTEPGKTYVIFSRSDHIDGSYPTYIPVSVNTAPKKCGSRIIGKERDF